MIKVVIEKLIFFQSLEDSVFPEKVSSQPVRLMNLENKHDVCQCVVLNPSLFHFLFISDLLSGGQTIRTRWVRVHYQFVQIQRLPQRLI
jgi:hypothetical protein